MGYTATWKVLEELMLDMQKKGAAVPPSVINDLRSAKLMIKISESAGSICESSPKVDQFLRNVEAVLLAEAQKTLGGEYVDSWIKRIDEANVRCEVCEEKPRENKFVVGVPRDQKWVRVEPSGNLTAERIKQIAKENTLSVNAQADGRLIVYGQQDNVKVFLKKMANAVTK